MKKLLLILLCLPMIGFGQSWTQTFGDNNNDDIGRCVQQTVDEGYIIMYQSEDHSSGICNTYLIKTDENGVQEWIQNFDTTDYEWFGRCVYQTADSGYICATSRYNGINLVKTDQNGIQQWVQNFGDNIYKAKSIQQTSDGGYVICATIENDYGSDSMCIIKADGNGSQQWNQKFIGGYSSGLYSIQEVIGGGYVVCGTISNDPFGWDIWLIRTDAQGNTLWNKTYDDGGHEWGHSVEQTSDGGYIITGSSDGDVWLIKADNLGNQQWSNTFGSSFDDVGYCVRQTSDGGYIITGYKENFSTGGDVYLIKTDSQGNSSWEQTFDGSSYDEGWYVEQTIDGGYIIAGFRDVGNNSSDVWLIKTDGNGNITSTFNIPTPNTNKKFLKATDLLGREIKQKNQSLFYIYDDGTVEKRIIIE